MRIAALLTVLVSLAALTGCTTGPDPAEATTLAYIHSTDVQDGAWCGMFWTTRNQPAAVAKCQAAQTPRATLLAGAPTIIRQLRLGDRGAASATIVVARVPFQSWTAVQLYRLLREQGGQTWYVDAYEADYKGDPASDDQVKAALG